ncbi:MAG: hypothetical protein ACXVGH_09615 [Mycobacteriales bacterium]
MQSSTEERLHVAVWAFHAAVQRRDGVAARLRRGDDDPELLDRSVAAAESVDLARLALYRLLVSEGWTPPADVAAELERSASAVLHPRLPTDGS